MTTGFFSCGKGSSFFTSRSLNPHYQNVLENKARFSAEHEGHIFDDMRYFYTPPRGFKLNTLKNIQDYGKNLEEFLRVDVVDKRKFQETFLSCVLYKIILLNKFKLSSYELKEIQANYHCELRKLSQLTQHDHFAISKIEDDITTILNEICDLKLHPESNHSAYIFLKKVVYPLFVFLADTSIGVVYNHLTEQYFCSIPAASPNEHCETTDANLFYSSAYSSLVGYTITSNIIMDGSKELFFDRFESKKDARLRSLIENLCKSLDLPAQKYFDSMVKGIEEEKPLATKLGILLYEIFTDALPSLTPTLFPDTPKEFWADFEQNLLAGLVVLASGLFIYKSSQFIYSCYTNSTCYQTSYEQEGNISPNSRYVTEVDLETPLVSSSQQRKMDSTAPFLRAA